MANEPAQAPTSAKMVVLAFSIDEDDNVIVMPTQSPARTLSGDKAFERLRDIIKREPAAEPGQDNSWASIVREGIKLLGK